MPDALRFLWWNVQDFAHFDPKRPRQARWPSSLEEYAEKFRRVEYVLKRLSEPEPPHLLGFAEITDTALSALQRHLYPKHNIHRLKTSDRDTNFDIGILAGDSLPVGNASELVIENVPRSTRSIRILDLRFEDDLIRFHFCHWPAAIDPSSEKWRQECVSQLNREVYRLLVPDSTDRLRKHAVILGDLNTEPFSDVLTGRLYGDRSRQRSRDRFHYSDQDIQRVRLYHCGWRMLGENYAHPESPGAVPVAGRYYRRTEKTWHTFDQIIVSGSLLGAELPQLIESSICFRFDAEWIREIPLNPDGLPEKFSWNNGEPTGLSDHLPLIGSIALSEKE